VERHVEITAPRRLRGFRRHLNRCLVVAEADPVLTSIVAALGLDSERRALAARLVLRVDPDAVLAELSRHAPDQHRAVLHEPRVDWRANPVPAGRVAGIGVGLDALHGRLAAEVAVVAEEPEAILHDRTAVRDAPIVGFEDAGILAEIRVQRLDLAREIVATRPLAGVVVEGGASEVVAARARDDVHDRPADVAFAEPAAHGDRDFIRVYRVVDIRREPAAARGRQWEAVDRIAPFTG